MSKVDTDRIWGDILRQVEWYADAEKRVLAEKKKREQKKEGKK